MKKFLILMMLAIAACSPSALPSTQIQVTKEVLIATATLTPTQTVTAQPIAPSPTLVTTTTPFGLPTPSCTDKGYIVTFDNSVLHIPTNDSEGLQAVVSAITKTRLKDGVDFNTTFDPIGLKHVGYNYGDERVWTGWAEGFFIWQDLHSRLLFASTVDPENPGSNHGSSLNFDRQQQTINAYMPIYGSQYTTTQLPEEYVSEITEWINAVLNHQVFFYPGHDFSPALLCP